MENIIPLHLSFFVIFQDLQIKRKTTTGELVEILDMFFTGFDKIIERFSLKSENYW